MFRVSQHPSSGVLKTVTAASGTGHNTGTAISLQRGLIGIFISIMILIYGVLPAGRSIAVLLLSYQLNN